MTDLQKEINAAFDIISGMFVVGDDQERAVMAKNHLRTAFRLANPPKSAQDDACSTAAEAVDRAVKEAVNNG